MRLGSCPPKGKLGRREIGIGHAHHPICRGTAEGRPEKDLASRYLDRFAKAVRRWALSLRVVAEMAESRASSAETRKREEAAMLDKTLSEGSVLILLDERGKALDSPAFADCWVATAIRASATW